MTVYPSERPLPPSSVVGRCSRALFMQGSAAKVRAGHNSTVAGFGVICKVCVLFKVGRIGAGQVNEGSGGSSRPRRVTAAQVPYQPSTK